MKVEPKNRLISANLDFLPENPGKRPSYNDRMEKKFSENLVRRISEYFLKRYGKKLTEEEARECLASLAGLLSILDFSSDG